MEFLLEGLKIVEENESENNLCHVSSLASDGSPHTARLNVLSILNLDVAGLYRLIKNNHKAIAHTKKALAIAVETQNDGLISNAHSNMVGYYLEEDNLDSALLHAELGYKFSKTATFTDLLGYAPRILGYVYLSKGDLTNARKYLFEAITQYHEINHLGEGLARTHIDVANLYKDLGKMDSCILNARIAIDILQTTISTDNLAKAYQVLADSYETLGKYDSAYKYQGLALKENNKAFDLTKLSQLQEVSINEHLKLIRLEEEKLATQNKIRMYGLLFGVGILLVIGFILYRNNRQKQKAYQTLQGKNNQIEQTLSDLRATQAQLVQSEKMASLGELTAGIAHEIQNPLNFVNNFSDVNTELIDEVNQEIEKGNLHEAKTLLNDLRVNQEKINHHGKRADGIVKSMLQHSRTNSGQKELTDINDLCDEYLRLSYHGYRAKDKSFTAKFETDFDQSLPKINVVPQDIGRVMLNLINNAFYAVSEKSKVEGNWFQPQVLVSTKNLGDRIEIEVKDNGNGISDSIREKIFQPFFTTKPTGQGTGLGLSLSYDIVKAHSGDIQVETIENKGTEFIIQLPV